MRYKINPFPAVRSNKNSWADKTVVYHNKMNTLRLLIENWRYTKNEIMKAMIDWNYDLIFHIEMPESWSNKKKLSLFWEPHRQTPDIDNLFKAFTDTIFYKEEKLNDKEIYTINARKYWDYEWCIEFHIT